MVNSQIKMNVINSCLIISMVNTGGKMRWTRDICEPSLMRYSKTDRLFLDLQKNYFYKTSKENCQQFPRTVTPYSVLQCGGTGDSCGVPDCYTYLQSDTPLL